MRTDIFLIYHHINHITIFFDYTLNILKKKQQIFAFKGLNDWILEFLPKTIVCSPNKTRIQSSASEAKGSEGRTHVIQQFDTCKFIKHSRDWNIHSACASSYFCRSGCVRADRLESWRWSWRVGWPLTFRVNFLERDRERGRWHKPQRYPVWYHQEKLRLSYITCLQSLFWGFIPAPNHRSHISLPESSM